MNCHSCLIFFSFCLFLMQLNVGFLLKLLLPCQRDVVKSKPIILGHNLKVSRYLGLPLFLLIHLHRPVVITILTQSVLQSVRPSQNFKIKRQPLPAGTVAGRVDHWWLLSFSSFWSRHSSTVYLKKAGKMTISFTAIIPTYWPTKPF